MIPVRVRRWIFAAVFAALLTSVPVGAQVATSLLNEDDPLPGAPGEIVSSINNPVVNHAGGFALTVNSTGSGTTLSNIWGNASGGPGTVILTEGTYGNLQQVSFESFHGLSNDGTPCYSASSTHTVSGTTGLDGAWMGTMVLLNEEDPVGTLPGQFSTFNSRPGITADGNPHWVGGISTIQGGSSQNRVLFFGTGLTPVLMGGDNIGGVAEPIRTGSSNIDFDYRFSELGTSYITGVAVEGPTSMDGVMVIDGDALFLDGAVVREGSPVPASIGGLPGENWDNFDFVGITEGGDYLITGDTDAPTANDEFVLVNGQIVLREGDPLETPQGVGTLSGSIEGGYLNADGDWTVIWDIDDVSDDNIEVLLVNGELVLQEGDIVDLDGDGIPEPNSVLRNFTGLTTLVMGDRQGVGTVPVYFTADIDVNGTTTTSDDIEGLYRIDVQVVEAIPVSIAIKPGSCLAPHNPASMGVMRVALAGSDGFDVSFVDISTLTMSRADGTGGSVSANAGPPGPQTSIGDATTASEAEACDCPDESPDGIPDVTMFFDNRELNATLELNEFAHDDVVELTLTGFLLDGTPFEGSDCVRIVGGAGPHVDRTAPSAEDGMMSFSGNQKPGEGREHQTHGESAESQDPASVLTQLGLDPDARRRLLLTRRVFRGIDPAMLPLLEEYLEQIREEAASGGDDTLSRDARQLLDEIRNSRR